jgi:DNA repair protein RadC
MSVSERSRLNENQLREIEVVYHPAKNDCIVNKISSSRDANTIFKAVYSPDRIEFIEEAYVLYLNRANKILGVYHLSKGSTTGTIMDIKHILAVALKSNASGIIISHNHPSGNLTPSKSDLGITQKLKDACDIMEISLLDHLILAVDGYYSMADEGDL